MAIYDKVMDRVAKEYMQAKAQDTSLGLRLVGGEVFSNDHAKMILASSTPIEVPAIRAYVYNALNFTASPVEDSYGFYQGDNGQFYATVIVTANKKKLKPLTEGKDLVQVSANSYLDENLGEVWNKENIEGVECYTRDNQTDLTELLASTLITASSNVERAVITAATFHNLPNKGDKVDICCKVESGSVAILTGTVTSVSENSVNVKSGEKTYSVPFGAVTKIYRDRADKQSIVDYLNKAYTPEGSDIHIGTMLKTAIKS